MCVAPLHIFENQVIPMGIHNLSKSFRPNLNTTRVFALGTKFIPKWRKNNFNKAFSNFNDFRRRLNNIIYFEETNPGVFVKNKSFRLKSTFWASDSYKELDDFCFNIRDEINHVILESIKDRKSQNLSNLEIRELSKLLKNKNSGFVFNDTDKNLGPAYAEKGDVLKECKRQLYDISMYTKLSENFVKEYVLELKYKLKKLILKHKKEGKCPKNLEEFLLSKINTFNIPHFYILWKMLRGRL